jgi:hypothetical protein
LKELQGIASKVINSDTADRKRGEALLHDLIAKVGGSSAELATSGEHIPEELPKSDYRILHLHASTCRAKVKLRRLERQLLQARYPNNLMPSESIRSRVLGSVVLRD